MLVRMLCNTNNLLPFAEEFTLNYFSFSSDNDLLESSLLDNNLKKVIGQIEVDKFKKSPFIFIETEYKAESEEVLSEEDIKVLQDNTAIYFQIFESFLSLLWLVKDNCISLETLYTYIPQKSIVLHKSNSSVYFTARGQQNEKVSFSMAEIERALELYVKASELFYHKIVGGISKEVKITDILTKRTLSPFDYRKVSRIERAFRFLLLARTTAQLPLRISLYMCIYESLFYGNNSGEIIHQIAERVALYSVDARSMRNAVYKQIKEAYKVRSIYFHGNSFESYKKDLSDISYNLDFLTRNVLVKILLKDSAIFLQDDENLERSFHDLLFEDERKPSGVTFESGINHIRFRS